ncbi:MAG: DEAD/DEAH box helicase [Propionibacteriales bacterium]|nr:DEAD/DEAH box helicase [Propionibacteriales bacterium]
MAFERLDDDLSFGRLAEDQVETIVAIALADIPDDPIDRAFVLLECLTLLIRDGQFARMKILASRLQAVSREASAGRRFLRLSISSIALSLSGHPNRAASNLDRGLRPEADPSAEVDVRHELAVAAAIKSVLVEDELEFAMRARDLFTRLGDGLSVALLDTTIAWQRAREAADPLSVLQLADPTFERPELVEYVRRRGIEVLFPSQIATINEGLTTDEELTVSLPTSSGKTLLAEFKIAATLARTPEATVIYVAPYRLLARQVTRSFEHHLSRLGHRIQDLGSGYDLEVRSDLGGVLICTPERLDALLRQASSEGDVREAFSRCRLVVFDEMHLIGRSGRGPRFELLLTRLRMAYPDAGFLALSAASQGVDEVASWLTSGRLVKGARRPTGTIEVSWRTNGELVQRVDRMKPTLVGELGRSSRPIDDAVLLISRLSSAYRPVLAVCTQRAYAESIATRLVESDPLGNRLWVEELQPEQVELLEAAVEVVASMMGMKHPLTTCLRNGVGFHHAGVPSIVLGLIEELAAERVLRAVSATTTVAEGADLPFRAVVIPHLNFQGNSRKLERDLYLNIIGRAGRVNVAMEGVVFILDSNAETLRHHVSTTLWTTAEVGRVRGQLTTITDLPRTPDETNWYGEFESQVMGWLGDGDSYHADQAELLAASTFTFQSGNSIEKRHVRDLTQTVLVSLERSGFAQAASPFRLTERGVRARLTGLTTTSVARLEAAIEEGVAGWLPSLLGVVELSRMQLEQIARIIFETSETMSHSLWLRRGRKNDAGRAAYLDSFARMRVDEHEQSDTFWAEVNAVVLWMDGNPFEVIADSMPTFGRTGLFGGSDQAGRVSDVAEYVSKIGYPGSWSWSAARTLVKEILALDLPAWIGGAIEFGASTETAVFLMRSGFLSRPGALHLATLLGPSWETASELLRDDDSFDSELVAVDQERLEQLRFLLRNPN